MENCFKQHFFSVGDVGDSEKYYSRSGLSFKKDRTVFGNPRVKSNLQHSFSKSAGRISRHEAEQTLGTFVNEYKLV